MWLIADSGSTKTEWFLFNSEEKRHLLISSGLNPLFLSESEFKDILVESVPKNWIDKVTKLWFYGAGCGTDRIKDETASWLKTIFWKAEIQVDSDLIASARATCGTGKGIVAILGTGSNSCYYNGQNIVNQVKPLGFILGDEGSGAALGKSLLKKLLRNQLPSHLSESIFKDLGMDYDKIVGRVYNSEWPNRFIASCARILHTYLEYPEIKALIINEFDQFVSILSSYKPQSKVHFVGSVAFYFKSYLEESLHKNGLTIGMVLESPAERLIDYHLKNSTGANH